MRSPFAAPILSTNRPALAPALSIERISKAWGSVVGLAGVTLDVPAGSCLALVGESGAGKSTLLKCLNRLEDPDGGRILIDGADIRSRDPVILRRGIGYVPQGDGLLPHWNVRRNAALVPQLVGMGDANRRADDVLSLVGLDPAVVGNRWPHELSGGQRQRVALARALAGGQGIMLLDEPFGALDAITRHELRETLLAIRAARPLTVVLVTHDLREALMLASAVAVLRNGRLEQTAAPDELVENPATPYVAELLSRSGVTS